jgi:hypothetical protein
VGGKHDGNSIASVHCGGASVVTAVVVGGAAWALQSPVDGNGVIHACYNAGTGAISLDVKGVCPKGKSTSITWDATGPKGPTGTAAMTQAVSLDNAGGGTVTPGSFDYVGTPIVMSLSGPERLVGSFQVSVGTSHPFANASPFLLGLCDGNVDAARPAGFVWDVTEPMGAPQTFNLSDVSGDLGGGGPAKVGVCIEVPTGALATTIDEIGPVTGWVAPA